MIDARVGDTAAHPLGDASARTLTHGDLTAIFLPGRGMLCASLRHRGEELLGRVDDLATAAAKGSTAGAPFLHPWANRLSGSAYRAAGRAVTLDPSSPLLHFDDHGLPMHGVPWSLLAWTVAAASPHHLAARLAWTRADLLAVFPFPHRVELIAGLATDGLTVETTLTAGKKGPVPVSFGFHPYLALPAVPRSVWRLRLPAMRRLVVDDHGIPTGIEEPFGGFDAPLGDMGFDDGFSLLGTRASFSLEGAGRRITVDFLAGFSHAQVFAPQGKSFIALEPMTAPTSALVSGNRLRIAYPGDAFQAAFRIRIDSEQ